MTIYKKLTFAHSLLQHNGRALGGDLLSKRLKALHAELQTLEQENTEVSTLSNTTNELISFALIEHKDKTIKAIVACCLADILRLYAPDAPYTEEQLGQLLQLFTEQLVFAYDVQSPLYSYSFFLLQNLAVVKSMALVGDLPDAQAEQILQDLINALTTNVSPTTPQPVKTAFIAVFSQILDAVPSIPPKILDIMLHAVSRRGRHRNVVAFELLCDILNNCKERLHLNLSQYFCEVILPDKKGEVDVKQAEFVHEVITELYEKCEGVLLSVIPQIEAELKIDNEIMRILATRTLGSLFAQKGSNLAKSYINCWFGWMQKKNDKSSNVRIEWLRHCFDIIMNDNDRASEIFDGLKLRLMDQEEKVRLETIRVLLQIVQCKELNVSELVPPSLVNDLKERCKDKRLLVRTEAIDTLAKFYGRLYNELIVATSPKLFKAYGWIPAYLAGLSQMREHDIYYSVVNALENVILKSNKKELNLKEYARKLMFIYTPSTDDEKLAFCNLLCLDRPFIALFTDYLDICVASKGQISDEVKQKSRKLAFALNGDQNQGVNVLHKFAQLNRQDIMKTMKALLDKCSEQKHEERLRARERINDRMSSMDTTMKKYFNRIFSRIFASFFAADMIPFISDIASGAVTDGSVNKLMERGAVTFLHQMTKLSLGTMKQNYEYFLSKLTSGEEASALLYPLYKLFQVSEYNLSLSSEIRLIFDEIVSSSKSVKAIKYATAILCLSDQYTATDAYEFAKTIVSVKAYDDWKLVRALVALTQFAKFKFNLITEIELKSVEDMVVNRLLENSAGDEKKKEKEDHWCKDEKLGAKGFAKIAGIQFIVWKTIKSISVDQFGAVANLFIKVIENEGELSPSKHTSQGVRTRIRLQVALGLLKLVQTVEYEKLLSPSQFITLSMTIQDGCFEVRDLFIRRLIKYLSCFKVHTRYLTLLSLVAYEPEVELKESVVSFAKKMYYIMSHQVSMYLPENILPILIHLVVHHPDFDYKDDPETSLAIAKDFISFFLKTIMNVNNTSLLLQLAIKVKTCKDVLNPECKDIYAVSDLTQMLIQNRCHAHNWALPVYQGKVRMPSNLFSPIESKSLEERILKTNFLPPEFQKIKERPVAASKQASKKKGTAYEHGQDHWKKIEEMEDGEEKDHQKFENDQEAEILPISKRSKKK